jgi:hypothetical protein
MNKYLLIIAVVVAAGLGSAATLYITKAVKPQIVVKTEKVVAPQCPPCNGIDFEKIKSKNITIENQQYLTIQGDSTLKEVIRQIISEEFKKAQLVRCKNR